MTNERLLARVGGNGPGAHAPARIRDRTRRKRDHSGGENMACAFCDGDGMVCNPGNADPNVKVVDWLYPVGCPRCGGTGKEPNHG